MSLTGFSQPKQAGRSKRLMIDTTHRNAYPPAISPKKLFLAISDKQKPSCESSSDRRSGQKLQRGGYPPTITPVRKIIVLQITNDQGFVCHVCHLFCMEQVTEIHACSTSTGIGTGRRRTKASTFPARTRPSPANMTGVHRVPSNRHDTARASTGERIVV